MLKNPVTLDTVAWVEQDLYARLSLLKGAIRLCLLFGFLQLTILAWWVLPTFVQLFEGMSLQLPWVTRAMIGFARAMNSTELWLLTCVGLASLPAMLTSKLRQAVARAHYASLFELLVAGGVAPEGAEHRAQTRAGLRAWDRAFLLREAAEQSIHRFACVLGPVVAFCMSGLSLLCLASVFLPLYMPCCGLG